jgi:hypothetical protein
MAIPGPFRWAVLMAALAVAGTACGSKAIHPAKVSTGNANAGGVQVQLSSYHATPLLLHVGQVVTVEVDPARFDWVGGDDYFAGVLKANNPCDATCSASARTFTAVAAGSASIKTVVNCRQAHVPVGVMCALGPVLDVKVTSATGTGTITGKLTVEGGPVDPGAPQARPLPGTVKFVSNGRQVAAATIGTTGLFAARLPAGSYRVEACTSQIQGLDAHGRYVDACAPPVQAVVRAGVTTAISIPPFHIR